VIAGPLAAFHAHRSEIEAAVGRVIERGTYILGPEVRAFEEEFAAYVGVDHAIGVGNGTEAIQLALWACGISPNERVATVSYTAVATIAAVELAGAVPVFVDIDPVTCTMDAGRLRSTVAAQDDGSPFRAIVPVHLYGHPADMESITVVARDFGLRVVEDCAQSHGARVAGRMTGSWGDFGAYSFYPTKNLGALGDGGALVTNDAGLADRARMLRQYGWKTRDASQIAGMNTRLDEIQAAILRVKLRYLDAENERRAELAAHYAFRLSGMPLELPAIAAGATHVFHQYVVRTVGRDGLTKNFEQEGVPVQVHYPVPVHLQPAYRGRVSVKDGELRVSERVCREVLSLPMHPFMEAAHVDKVCDVIERWARSSGGG
jgi:dTDP-4-amino-4,6-dideoxygalactose transaminase